MPNNNQASLLTAAIRYAELGYPVFLCAPGGKVPITKRGFRDATSDAEQIERWWTQHPNANIGIPTAGLVVIDIDGPSNPWPGDPDRAHDLAAGPMSLTPSGGKHHIFRQPAEKHWRCTTSVLATKVDTRADGGYIVVPPSVVEDKAYRWVPGQELDQPPDQLPEPPEWLVRELDRLQTVGVSAARKAIDGGHKITEGERNSTLASLAGEMRRIGKTQSDITAKLLQVNANRCVPPLSIKEVEIIAGSIAKKEPDQIATAEAEGFADTFFGTTNNATTDPPDDTDPSDDTDGADTTDNLDPGPIPDELLHVPGFIAQVMRYTLDTSPYPEPVIAFAGALILQAFLAGRKVRDRMGNRTNLYILNLANSGVGKQHARNVNAAVLAEAGLANGLGTSFASGEGIEDRLRDQPTTLFQVDEIDGLLMRVTQAKDARHEQIVSMLLQMYSSAATRYVTRAKAGQERAEIDQPCLCLFGAAIPKNFYQSLSARLLENGFVARLVILECRKRGTGQDEIDKPIPASILDTARWWANYQPGGNLNHEHPSPRLIPHNDDAQAVFRAFRASADAEYNIAEDKNDQVAMSIWTRAHEKARRLAMIYACSERHENPQITAAAARWACEFVGHQTRRMLYMAQRYASEGEFDARRKRLLDVLAQWREKHGDVWMPFWKLSRKLPWSARELEELRNTLIEQKLIEYRTTITRGRPGVFYRLKI
jgi:hypothetical protein